MRVEKRRVRETRKPRRLRKEASTRKPDETITVSDDFRIPGTNYIVEAGDELEIFEADKKKTSDEADSDDPDLDDLRASYEKE